MKTIPKEDIAKERGASQFRLKPRSFDEPQLAFIFPGARIRPDPQRPRQQRQTRSDPRRPPRASASVASLTRPTRDRVGIMHEVHPGSTRNRVERRFPLSDVSNLLFRRLIEPRVFPFF